jgi:hypothetical protein
MKTIIAGSRSINDYKVVKKAIVESGFQITEVVSGGAKGVDRLGERWARENRIPIQTFLPDWIRQGKSAGIIRNIDMAGYADALIAIWDGVSKGTAQMIESAKLRGLKIYIHQP